MSSLQPLTSDESRKVVTHLWKAIEVIPKHKHNKGANPDDCPTCVAYNQLILAFRVFRRVGDK